MAGQIRITPDTMRERAGAYRMEADTVNSVLAKMDNLLSMLMSEWEGVASQAYDARFQQLRPSFVAAEELIREIAAALDATANSLEQRDAEIASMFNS